MWKDIWDLAQMLIGVAAILLLMRLFGFVIGVFA